MCANCSAGHPLLRGSSEWMRSEDHDELHSGIWSGLFSEGHLISTGVIGVSLHSMVFSTGEEA